MDSLCRRYGGNAMRHILAENSCRPVFHEPIYPYLHAQHWVDPNHAQPPVEEEERPFTANSCVRMSSELAPELQVSYHTFYLLCHQDRLLQFFYLPKPYPSGAVTGFNGKDRSCMPQYKRESHTPSCDGTCNPRSRGSVVWSMLQASSCPSSQYLS